jgi:hypothetical protein
MSLEERLMFTQTTENAITALSTQLAANAAGVTPRGLAEHTLRHLRNGGFTGAIEEVNALIHEHGYWEVETAVTRLIESSRTK